MQTKLDKIFRMTVDISNRKVTIPEAITWYVTDANIAHINCQVIDEVEDSIADIANYELSMRVLTPGKLLHEVEFSISDVATNTFTVAMPDELIKEKGRHQCELVISYLGDILTSQPFNYNMVQSIASLLDDTIAKDSHYPLVLELEDKLNEANNILDDQINRVIMLNNDMTNAGRTRQANEAQRIADENTRSEFYDGFYSRFEHYSVNVMDFGAKGDGVTDDTQAIKDAIAYAQSHPSKTIFLPKTTNSYLITDTINFYRMNVECPATIKVGFNGIGIIAGSSSSLGENYTIYINNITHANYIEGDISVRVQGSKRMKFTFGSMQKLQIYANGSNTTNSSVAYCQFDLIGNIAILELLGENSMGWINENTFYKGRIQNVIIGGDYAHNKNVFFDSCIEGGNITINNGICNKFINIRNENLQSIYFSSSTHHNIIELSYYSAAANTTARGTVTDYGVSNRIIDPEDCFASVEFLNMDAYNCKLLEGTHTDTTVNEDTFVLGSWKYITTVDIPYRYAKRIFVSADTDNGTRINIEVLDSNKNVVPTQYIQCMGTTWDATNTCLRSSANSKAISQIVSDGIRDGVDLAYIRVKVYTGNQTVTFNRINITVRCNPIDIPYINMAKPRINYNKLSE